MSAWLVRYVFFIVLIMGVFDGVVLGASPGSFDFKKPTIESIRSKAAEGSVYHQGLYGGLVIWGYASAGSMGGDGESPEVSEKKSDEPVKKSLSSDWSEMAGTKIVTPEAKEAVKQGDWVDLSAAAGDPVGLYFQAYRTENQTGFRDLAKLRDLWGRASAGLEELAVKDDSVALTLLGLMNEEGVGVDKSPSRAKELYARAKEAGSALAAHQLSLMLMNEAKSINDYKQVLKLNEMAVDGQVRGAGEVEKMVMSKAENQFQKKAFPFLPILMPGEYHFLGFFSKFIINIGGWVFAVLGGFFGWFIFPYTLAPIKLLIRAPMEIFVDRVLGAVFFFVFSCVLSKNLLVNLFY